MRMFFALLFVGSSAIAQESSSMQVAGLEAWDEIYAVASHPRCTNCHVGAEGKPMWEGLGFEAGRKHGLGVIGGESRIGAETVPCRTCHITTDRPNSVPHAPPHILEAWRLPPVELNWFGKSSQAVCLQLRNEMRNGEDLVAHVRSSPFVAWGFEPGGERSPAPSSIAALAANFATWEAAGTPCR
jgi:hypothetical protein